MNPNYDTKDMLATYIRRARLPEGLRTEPVCDIKYDILKLADEIRSNYYSHKKILIHGLRRGKTTSAAYLLLEYLKTRQGVISNETPGLFLSVNQLCYQNRTIDRYQRDEGLQHTLSLAMQTDFLVLDSVFSYLTQNDDLMLQALYDARQHSAKTTIITTSVLDPADCAGSILFRMFRDADVKVVMM